MSVEVIEKPKVSISEDILKDLKTQVDEQGQVILHFLFVAFGYGQKIRIWPSTYLFDADSDHKSEMVLAENISMAPEWTSLDPGTAAHFTLIFNGLPKSCSQFHFQEFCPGEGGAFNAKNIKRNESDVYFLRIG